VPGDTLPQQADDLRVRHGAVGVATGIDYDRLGRKEGMDDPDMGAWSYEYYPAEKCNNQLWRLQVGGGDHRREKGVQRRTAPPSG
jgi:hypothetical protein